LHFSVLGLLAGVLAGLSIVVYRFIVESPLGAMLPVAIRRISRRSTEPALVLVLGGALLLGLIAQLIPAFARSEWRTHRPSIATAADAKGTPPGVLRRHAVPITGQRRKRPRCSIGAAVSGASPATTSGCRTTASRSWWCGTAASIAAAFDTPLPGWFSRWKWYDGIHHFRLAPILAAAAGATVARSTGGPCCFPSHR
jgi:hypothetical protein